MGQTHRLKESQALGPSKGQIFTSQKVDIRTPRVTSQKVEAGLLGWVSSCLGPFF